MYTVTRETFDSLSAIRESNAKLLWNSVFVLPAWMRVWWQQFDGDSEPHLAAVRDGAEVIGIAALRIEGDRASIIGSDNVCDYVDLVSSVGREEDFSNAILDYVRKQGVAQLDMGLLRPDSVVVLTLAGVAGKRGASVSMQQEDVSVEMDLPSSFDDYLATLSGKQRHEVRRKLRRLEEAGKVEYSSSTGGSGLDDVLDTFVGLFSKARGDKAIFMTPEMESFFRSLAHDMARAGLLRLGRLDYNGQATAMIMCFDYNDSVYLYNSGYDPQYESLSVGLLSKVFCIKESIQQGRKRFEFLKGNEVYKQRLGGKEIPLYRCRIAIA